MKEFVRNFGVASDKEPWNAILARAKLLLSIFFSERLYILKLLIYFLFLA